MPDAECRDRPDRHQRDGKADGEAEHEDEAQREFLELQAEQQDGDGGGARDQAAGQAEEDDLPGRHLPVGEAAADIVGMGQFMRILIAIGRDVQPAQLLMHMVVTVALHEGEVVVVAVIAVPEAEARHEFVRLRDFGQGFQIVPPVGESEDLNGSIRPFRRDLHVVGLPDMAPLGPQAKDGRHARFEDLQRNDAMPGIDPAHLLAVAAMPMAVPVVMIVPMRVMMTLNPMIVRTVMSVMRVPGGGLCHLLVMPGAPEHPQRDGDDDRRRSELEIGFHGLGIDATPQIEAGEGNAPDDGGMRDRRRDAEQRGLQDRAADGHDEGCHHRLGMAGLQPVQRAEEDRAGDEEPGMGGALAEQFGETGHVALLTGIW